MKVRSWQNPHAPRAANGDEESEPIMTVPRERAEILDEKVENRWFNPFSWLNTTGGAFWQNAPRISTLPLQRTPPQNLPRASCASTQEFSNAEGLPALLRWMAMSWPAVQRVLGLYRLTYDTLMGVQRGCTRSCFLLLPCIYRWDMVCTDRSSHAQQLWCGSAVLG